MRQRTAEAQSRQQQKPSAHNELISAQGQGVLPLGIPLEKRDGEAVGQRRQQHRTVPQQGESSAQSAAGPKNSFSRSVTFCTPEPPA